MNVHRTQGKGSTLDALCDGINYKKGSFYAVPTLHAPQDSRRSQAIDLLQKPVGQFPFHILQAITPAIQLDSQYEVNKPSTHVVS